MEERWFENLDGAPFVKVVFPSNEDPTNEGYFFRDKADYERFFESSGQGSRWDGLPDIEFLEVETEEEFSRAISVLQKNGYRGQCPPKPVLLC
jgi:hypothetical protein